MGAVYQITSDSPESLGKPFNRQVWKPALRSYLEYGNRSYEICRADIPIRRVFGQTIPSVDMETCPTEFVGDVYAFRIVPINYQTC